MTAVDVNQPVALEPFEPSCKALPPHVARITVAMSREDVDAIADSAGLQTYKTTLLFRDNDALDARFIARKQLADLCNSVRELAEVDSAFYGIDSEAPDGWCAWLHVLSEVISTRGFLGAVIYLGDFVEALRTANAGFNLWRFDIARDALDVDDNTHWVNVRHRLLRLPIADAEAATDQWYRTLSAFRTALLVGAPHGDPAACARLLVFTPTNEGDCSFAVG